jgi:hypothetical protein
MILPRRPITDAMRAAGTTVTQLWRWPVKGMGGEPMPSVRVDGRGVGGDRTHAIVRRTETGWGPLSGRDAGGLRAWSAAYPFNIGANVEPASPPYAIVCSPQQRTFVWGDPRLRSALEDDLGLAVELRRDIFGMQLVERSVLLTWGDDDPRELRSNLHLHGELALEPGQVLAFERGVRMRILRACNAGGVYARVLANGRVAVGEAVQLSAF